MKPHNICASWIGVMLKGNDPTYPGNGSGAFDLQGNLQEDDLDDFCWMISDGGANQTRLFASRAFKEVSPGLWDKNQIDPKCFFDLERMSEIAYYGKTGGENHRIVCVATIFDNCELHARRVNPESSNLQKIVFYDDLPRSLLIVAQFVAMYHRLKAKGIPLNLEVVNEGQWNPGWNKKEPLKTTGNVMWFSKMYRALIDGGVAAEDIVYGPRLQYDTKSTQDIIGQAAEIWRIWWGKPIANERINASRMVVHNALAGPDLDFAIKTFGRLHKDPRDNPFVSDDGIEEQDRQYVRQVNGKYELTKPGQLGRWPRLTTDELRPNIRKLFQGTDGNWTIELLQYPDQLKASLQVVAEEHKDAYCVYPHEYGSHPKPEEPPPVVVPPVVVPTIKPPINWRGEWNNNWKIIVGGTIVLVILAIFIL
jgi:hypothetical protein